MRIDPSFRASRYALGNDDIHVMFFVIVLSQEFACYASTDCRGATVDSLPQKEECCGRKGLSFTPKGSGSCKNCFSKLNFHNMDCQHLNVFFSILAVCPDLTDPTDGYLVLMTGASVGDIAVYICKSGFELVGTATLTCQSDGTWSDLTPVCKNITGMRKKSYSIILWWDYETRMLAIHTVV